MNLDMSKSTIWVKIGVVGMVLVILLLVGLHQNRDYAFNEQYTVNYYSFEVENDREETAWVDEDTYYFAYGDMTFYLMVFVPMMLVSMTAYGASKDLLFFSSKLKFIGLIVLMIGQLILFCMVDRGFDGNGGVLDVTLGALTNIIFLGINAIIVVISLIVAIVKKHRSLLFTSLLGMVLTALPLYLITVDVYWFITFLYVVAAILTMSFVWKDLKELMI